MHHIYTTKAIIIKSMPVGEANRYYFLLTEDLGFIRASAQSVRASSSKLKGHLQDFCLVQISLVKGKEVWRITSVETIITANFIKNPHALLSVKNIFSLLLRLLHGEEKNEALFRSVESFYHFLSKQDLSDSYIKNLETITVLRILAHLGYYKKNSNLSEYLKNDELSSDLLGAFDQKKAIAVQDINDVLAETHL